MNNFNETQPAYPIFMSFCECTPREPEYARDCYYFSEEADMGAHIPCCDALEKFGYEPKGCNSKCKHYISNKEVRRIIDEKIRDKYA